MGLLDIFTGGKSAEAENAQKQALAAIQGVTTPTIEQMTLPELQKYAVSQNMTPAQTQAFIQEYNDYATRQVDQGGTEAQKAAIAQLAQVAEGGAEGSPTQRAQQAQITQDMGRELAGQRGAIDQQAQARGVAPGLLQAALGQQQAGQGIQNAHMAALQAQGQNYQQALNAMAQGGALGGQLQSQQNQQANAISGAQNAMQQFNAANQQQAATTNAGYQQAANAYNTQMANQVGMGNTELANQRTQYNTALPQQNFANQMAKQGAVAGQYGNLANMYTGQGQQTAAITGGLIGTGAKLAGGMMGGPAGAVAADQGFDELQNQGLASTPPAGYKYAEGGVVDEHRGCMHSGGLCLKGGGVVPGHPEVPGDSLKNDTVHIMASPGEAVIPRTVVQKAPDVVAGLLDHQEPQIDPRDVASLLLAMRSIRGGVSHAL
jgi:hypothetical protein